MDHSELFMRLSQSKFRSSFRLKEKDKKYAAQKGLFLIAYFFLLLLFSVMFLNQGRLISEKGGKKKADEHRGTLPDIF